MNRGFLTNGQLGPEFYMGSQVNQIAEQLLGKLLVTSISGHTTSGVIVETEGYSFKEKGCHAFRNRMTRRNEAMFLAGGHAYVYLCYGIHHMFNVVTNREGQADAVLIRAIEPVDGVEIMKERMQVTDLRRITAGPGKLAKAMGIDLRLNKARLDGTRVWIEAGKKIMKSQRVQTTRIGIDYAGEDALLPWRHYFKDNEWVSKK